MPETSTTDSGGVSTREKSDDSAVLLERANICQRNKDFERAELIYRILLKREPQNAELYEHLGMSHLRREQLKKAQAAFQSAFRLESPHKGMLENAIVALQSAIKYPQEDSRYLQFLGQCWRSLGYPDLALEFFAKAIEADSSNAAAHNQAGVILYNHDRIAKALGYFVDAARARSGIRGVLDNIGTSMFLILRHRHGDNLLPDDGENYVGVDESEPFSSVIGSALIYSPSLGVVYGPLYGALDIGVNEALYEAERRIITELPACNDYLPAEDLRWIMANALSLRRYRVGEAHRILSSKKVVKFSIVMNPFERFANEYLRTFVVDRDKPESKQKVAPVLNFAVTEDVLASEEFVTFREFVEYLVERRGSDVHHEWWPLSRTVHPGYLDLLMRVESIDADLRTLEELCGLRLYAERPDSERSVSREKRGCCADSSPEELLARPTLPTAAELYDEELEQAVRTLYSSDFQLFNYSGWTFEQAVSLPFKISSRPPSS